MKVLHVIGSMNPIYGGPCQGVRNLISASSEFSIKREVLCLDDPNSEFIAKDSFPIHAVGPRKGAWWYSSKLLPWLTNNAKNYDVIIINGLWLYLSFAVWKVMRVLKKKAAVSNMKIPKFFVMPHGMLDPYFQLATSRKLKALRNTIYWRFIEHRVVNDVDGLLFTCEEELQLAQKSFGSYKPKREINIGYGITPPPAYSTNLINSFLEKCPEVKGHDYILFLGRINYKKGVDVLIEAYKQVLDANPNAPKLVIAGPGLETDYGQEMLRLTNRYSLTDHVLFPGLLMGDAKWGSVYGSDAFVLSSYQENFGISVVEALACRVPVLISNNVNIWREIEMGEGGIIFQNSVDGLKKAIETWIKLPAGRKKLIGENAIHIYESRFAIGPVVDRFISAVATS